MKMSGFTFVKDAVKFYFPVVESIRSMLPLCDEVMVNVGLPDTDGTLQMIESIDDAKLRVFTTEWDPLFLSRGRILAQQTNLSLYGCRGDWCLYLQADEVLHEEDYPKIRKAVEHNLGDERVEGLLFDYIHFFGDYRTYIRSYHWYRKEIRIIRNRRGITSWQSAQGFRLDGRKLRVKESGARIFHYGWVRPTKVMRAKKAYHDELHHGETGGKTYERFEFSKHIDPFATDPYEGSHPQVMKQRIAEWGETYEPVRGSHRLTLGDWRNRATDVLARITGLRIGEYKNYTLLKE